MRRTLLALLLLALGAAAPAWGEAVDPFAPLEPPELDPEERARVERGEVLVRSLPPSDGRGMGVEAIGRIEASPARVWSVMADCEDQDEYLPRVLRAEVRDRDGAGHVCEIVIDLPFPVDDSRSATRNRLRRLPDGGYQRHWTLAPGDWSYERHRGSWTVHPDGPDHALLVNRMDLLPRSVLPIWVLRAAQAREAPGTFAAIRARVRSHGIDAVTPAEQVD